MKKLLLLASVEILRIKKKQIIMKTYNDNNDWYKKCFLMRMD